MDLKDLKKNYEKLASKYKMPDFDKLNVGFEIDKMDKETDFILRVIRKIIMEKVVNSMGFLEMLINPMNTHRMYMSYMNSMNNEDRKLIDKMYGELADLSLASLELEIDTDEKRESEMIKKAVDKWNELKPGFRKILANIRKPSENNLKKEKDYFG